VKGILALTATLIFSALNYLAAMSETCTQGGDPFWPMFVISLPALALANWALAGVRSQGISKAALVFAVCLLVTPIFLVYAEMIIRVSFLGHHPCGNMYDQRGVSLLDRWLPFATVGSAVWIIVSALKTTGSTTQPGASGADS
jgi:hypothetical protein